MGAVKNELVHSKSPRPYTEVSGVTYEEAEGSVTKQDDVRGKDGASCWRRRSVSRGAAVCAAGFVQGGDSRHGPWI